jgi:membrane-associated phospholipid phosphatase
VKAFRPAALLLPTLVVVAASGSARGESAPEPVPLRETFSPFEIGASLGAAAGGVFLLLAGNTVFSAPKPSMGAPDPDSLDARVSRRLYAADGSSHRFLWGAPDVAGYVLPVVPLLFYGASSVSLTMTGAPWCPTGDRYPQHRLMAYVEALGWTYLVAGVAKYAVGRPRPYVVNQHPELRQRASEDNLSFFSNHAASTFAIGAFVAEDASRRLRIALADQLPAVRFVAGTLLPYTLGYGVPALVAYSRLVDQQHWLSDVAVGALTGTLITHLVYDLHFDDEGRPRRRLLPRDGRLSPVIARRPDGSATLSLAFAASF